MTAITPYQHQQAAINAAALPLLGVLHKGAVKSANKPGADLDHFRIAFRPGFEHLAPDFARLYGDQPSSIPGLRLVGDCPFWWCYEKWGGNQALQIRHDGRVYSKRWTADGYDTNPAPVLEADLDRKVCQPVGRLHFMLPEFVRETGVIGTFIALTGSEVDRQHIGAYLGAIELMGVSLSALTFTLSRQPTRFVQAIKGQPSRITKHMLRLEVQPEQLRAVLVGPGREINQETGEITYDHAPARQLDSGDDLPAPRPMTANELKQAYDYAKQHDIKEKAEALEIWGVSDPADFIAPYPLDEARLLIDAHVYERDQRSAQQVPLIDVPDKFKYE